MMLFDWLQGLLFCVAMILAVPVAVIVSQIAAAKKIHPSASVGKLPARPVAAILVPAHNESAVICHTLLNLSHQLKLGDRLLVVADNCTDDTAPLARSLGAEVVEREDSAKRSKGYALDFGLRQLARNQPSVVLIVDADCQLKEGSLDVLVELALRTGRPIQALDLMQAPQGAGLKTRMAEFAWRVKNWARPSGWHRLGWPCQLMGTGMAFPWAVAERIVSSNALANGDLAEDMKLGADLALAGTPPMFCPEALVTSEFPTATAAQQSQRKRWEHGHLHVITSVAPRLLWQGIRRRHMPTVAMALDMLVPPVALLALLLALLWCAALGLVLAAGAAYAAPLVVASVLVVLFKLALWRAWRGWGRDLVSAREWLQVPFYLAGKLPVYLSFLFKRQKAWVRTDRK